MSKEYDVFDVICPYCGKTKFGVLLKPNTTHRIICPECKHITYVKVMEDLSIQMYKEDEVCPNCHGTGYVTCPKCGGDGYLIYVNDPGAPVIRWFEESKRGSYRLSELEDEIDLGVSHEFSIIGCPECGGKGSYKIGKDYYVNLLNELDEGINKIVKGTGKIKCSRCNGKGFITKIDKDEK